MYKGLKALFEQALNGNAASFCRFLSVRTGKLLSGFEERCSFGEGSVRSALCIVYVSFIYRISIVYLSCHYRTCLLFGHCQVSVFTWDRYGKRTTENRPILV